MSITNQAAPSSAADLTGRRCTCGAAAETAATIASAPPPPSPKLTIGGLTLWSCLWAIFLAASLSESLTTCEAAETILLPGRSGREGKHRDRLVGNQTGPRCSLPDPSLYLLPVVGILTHPGDGASGRLSNATGVSFIAASYVKFVEAAGARVIPLIYNEHRDVLNEKLSLVNGVLFTGGWAKTGLYFETAQYLLQKILERNDAGDHCPLFVICLGFEIVCMAVSKDNDILEPFTARSQVSTLEFVEDVELEGTVFRRFPPDLLEKLSKDCLVLQNHRWGISPKRLQGNAALSSFFKILTTSFDENGLEYVSTVQGQRYPVTGFQWHPEVRKFYHQAGVILINVTCLISSFILFEVQSLVRKMLLSGAVRSSHILKTQFKSRNWRPIFSSARRGNPQSGQPPKTCWRTLSITTVLRTAARPGRDTTRCTSSSDVRLCKGLSPSRDVPLLSVVAFEIL